MINRLFFISEHAPGPAESMPPEEELYHSILLDPLTKGALGQAYILIDDRPTDSPLSLVLDIHSPLSDENMGCLGSFLFLPAYLRIGGRPVINLRGNRQQVLRDAANSISGWLAGQGFEDPLIQVVPVSAVPDSLEELIAHYESRLGNGPDDDEALFFHAPSAEIRQAALSALRGSELAFQRRDPRLYSLLYAHRQLETAFRALHRKYTATADELQHQRQYVDILRTEHAAREIQDYYDREYEVLPLWYKRFGHLVKVLMGKRSFGSLFRKDLKKHKI